MQSGHEQDEHGKRPLDVLILAAGLGTRMRSDKAKVLHKLDGQALILHVCRAAATLSPRMTYVVVGHQADEVEKLVRDAMPTGAVSFVRQNAQLGTGDAVNSAAEALAGADSTVLILSGDVPLIEPDTLRSLVDLHRESATPSTGCTVLSVEVPNPTGYGRVVRNDAGEFSAIVEQRDASESERKIGEINAGIYCFESQDLFPALSKVNSNNAQGEYYLTDVPSIMLRNLIGVRVFLHDNPIEVSGINTRAELAGFETIVRERTIQRLMLESGVTFVDPATSYISSTVDIGRDCIIHPNVYIEGNSSIGQGTEIHSGTRIVNSTVGAGVIIRNHCLIFDSSIGDNCALGPFAHLKMGSSMADKAAVGNFVEVKNTKIGSGSKAMHLSYLGDTTIGEKTNIGAGTITCNYDGKKKNPTIIESGVFIGSDTLLIAPVRVGSGSITAAGSVVTTDVPPNTMVAGVPAKIKRQIERESGEGKA